VTAPIPHASNGNTRPIDRVLAHLEGVRRSGDGWVARCSHHDDRQASLSVKEGADGRVLLHCFAGCGNADVVVSAGLAFVDLFPSRSRERWQPRVWMGGVPMAPHGRPALESLGDDRTASMLGELARLAHVRGKLDPRVAGAVRIVAEALGVSAERLTEAVRAALATEEPA
jgi:hypothetical protein